MQPDPHPEVTEISHVTRLISLFTGASQFAVDHEMGFYAYSRLMTGTLDAGCFNTLLHVATLIAKAEDEKSEEFMAAAHNLMVMLEGVDGRKQQPDT